MPTLNLDQANFTDTIDGHEIVLIDFWASWCGPCRMFGPIYEEASDRHPGIVFGKVDTEAQSERAAAFQITSIPTLMAFRNQVIVFAQPGALPGSMLEDLIGRVEALDMDDVRRRVAEAEAEAEAEF
jgi:thioredoxin 1